MDSQTHATKAAVSDIAPNKSFYFAELSLRILVIAFSLAGAVTTLTSRQSVIIFGMVMNASYSYSSSFRYKVVADTLVCGLALVSVTFLISLNRRKSNPNNYFYLLVLDLVCLMVLLSACSAGMAVGVVAKFGQAQTGWMAICDRVEKFCGKMTVSMVISFLAVIALFLLTLTSAHKLKSRPL